MTETPEAGLWYWARLIQIVRMKLVSFGCRYPVPDTLEVAFGYSHCQIRKPRRSRSGKT